MSAHGSETNTTSECTVGPPLPERTIVVIGSGLAGLTAAIGLAGLVASSPTSTEGKDDTAEGFPQCSRPMGNTVIEVVEKRPVYDVRGAAFGMAPNGLKAMREVCPEVAQTLLDEGIYMPFTGGHLLPWYRVREALLKHAKTLSDDTGSVQIRFRMGWTLERIEQEPDVEDGQEGSPVRAYFTNGEMLEGSLLIAADGIHSKVRGLLGLQPALQPPASRIWRGHAKVPEDSVLYPIISNGEIMPLGSMTHGPTLAGAFSLHEKSPGAVAWTVSTKASVEERNTSVWKVIDAFLEASKADNEGAASSSPSNEELFCELLRLTPEADLNNVFDNTVVMLPEVDGSGWGGQGRVVLVGDAAHAMRPASGLGGAMAFEDAQLLCRKLKPWIQNEWEYNGNNQSLPNALREFENERLVRVRRIWDTEWTISESAYAEKPVDPASLSTDEYKAWLYAGI